MAGQNIMPVEFVASCAQKLQNKLGPDVDARDVATIECSLAFRGGV